MTIPISLAGVIAVAFTWAVPAGRAAAQEWPLRPVTMVIPFGAGSGIDVLGRILAPAMAEKIGQPIVIENVGGAGGMTGAARVAKASPDGYTFVLGNVGTHAQNQSLYPHPLYHAMRDFAPVASIADTRKSRGWPASESPLGMRSFCRRARRSRSSTSYAMRLTRPLICPMSRGGSGRSAPSLRRTRIARRNSWKRLSHVKSTNGPSR